jgi:hypothetical protein
VNLHFLFFILEVYVIIRFSLMFLCFVRNLTSMYRRDFLFLWNVITWISLKLCVSLRSDDFMETFLVIMSLILKIDLIKILGHLIFHIIWIFSLTNLDLCIIRIITIICILIIFSLINYSRMIIRIKFVFLL